MISTYRLATVAPRYGALDAISEDQRAPSCRHLASAYVQAPSAFVTMLAVLLSTTVLLGWSGTAAAAAPDIVTAPTTPPSRSTVSMPAKVVAAYWRTDSSPRLSSASSKVNVFFLAFAKSAESGSGRLYFNPDEGSGVTPVQMQADIATVQARGAKVILSIGGAVEGGIAMRTEPQVAELVSSVTSICDVYECDGIDWDLEQGGSGTNLESLVSASAQLKAMRGADFLVTVSVEPGLALYEEFALATGRATVDGKTYSGLVCDLYGPQFYDFAQTREERKADIVAIATRLVGLGLPAPKFVIGTTYAGSALGASGQMPPRDYLAAYNSLQSRGISVRGAYVWDMTIESRNGYVFASVFGAALGT